MDTSFQELFYFISLVAWKLKFYHWEHILSIVFLEVVPTVSSFLRTCPLFGGILYSGLTNDRFSISHSSKWKCSFIQIHVKVVFHLESLVTTQHIQLHKYLFLRQPSHLVCSRIAVYVLLMFSHRKWHVLKDRDLIKLIIFTILLRTF